MTIREAVLREQELTDELRSLTAWLNAKKNGETLTDIQVTFKYADEKKTNAQLDKKVFNQKELAKIVEENLENLINQKRTEQVFLKQTLNKIQKEYGEIKYGAS